MTLTNKRQGEYLLRAGESEFKLKASFRNIAQFEQHMKMGIYQVGEKFSEGDVRLTDIASLVYCFDTERDSDGHTYDDIGEVIYEAGIAAAVTSIAGFLAVLFAAEDQPKASASANKKK